jgi:amidophosphoribosyltransferase
VFASGVQNILEFPYHEALVKNRYIDRTFIVENKNQINKTISRKLNTVDYLVKDKNVLLVDDSIVRGNTLRYVVSLLKKSGAKKISMASAAPPVRYSNEFGIFIESSEECVAYKRDYEEIAKVLGVDKIIYNELDEITSCLKNLNNNIVDFECSMFNNERCYNKYL